MAETKNILNKPNPATGWSGPEFVKPAFDQATWDKGYDIYLERAVRCPCCEGGNARVDCQNCFGTGFFYVNKEQTRGIITGINQTNKYQRWSEELLGTVAVTVQDSDKPNLSYYDRLTLQDEFSYYSEVLEVRAIGFTHFVFTTYRPVEKDSIIAVYRFIAPDQPLKMVSPDNYSVSPENPYCIIVPEVIPEGSVLSVYYRHCPEYHVIDIPHEIRSSWETQQGQVQKIRLPMQAIARRSHLIMIEKPNFDGSGVQINQDMPR